MLIKWLTGNQPGRIDFVAQDYGESMVISGAAEEVRPNGTPEALVLPESPEPETIAEPAPPAEMVPTAEDTAPPSIQMDTP
jgi:hypothetical protein